MNIKMILFVLIINVIGCADIIVFGNNNENIHVFISSFFLSRYSSLNTFLSFVYYSPT
ncbi:Uncharacterised protein [Escherichia coli]|nr:Uncharacterised protein [Escherichia coli]